MRNFLSILSLAFITVVAALGSASAATVCDNYLRCYSPDRPGAHSRFGSMQRHMEARGAVRPSFGHMSVMQSYHYRMQQQTIVQPAPRIIIERPPVIVQRPMVIVRPPVIVQRQIIVVQPPMVRHYQHLQQRRYFSLR